MSDVFQISEAASLGLHAMVFLAAHPQQKITTPAIARHLQLSEHHLAKVMRRLVNASLIFSTRGPGGGFQLSKSSKQISLLDVYEALEGKLKPRQCLLGVKPLCPNGKCILGGINHKVHEQIKKHFQQTKLSDLMDVFGGDS